MENNLHIDITMSDQQFFNILISVIGLLGGWWIRVVWQSVKDLQTQDTKLAEKVSSIEILVVGQYVKRDEIERLSDALFKKLDRIENKLDGKVDKE